MWLAAPKGVVGEQGKVKALICEVMQLGEPDASGRRTPVSTGETITLEVDMVIKAAGQVPFEALVNEYELDNKDGKLVINQSSSTNIPGVFAGGDCVNGGKEVVDAVQAGKEGASAVLQFLGLV